MVFIVGIISFTVVWFYTRQPEYVIGAIGCTFYFLMNLPFAMVIKNIRITDKCIFVRAFSKELEYPFIYVNKITEFKWYSGRIITIHLTDSVGVSRKIRFIPKYSLFAIFRSHPIVAELNKIVENLRMKSVKN